MAIRACTTPERAPSPLVKRLLVLALALATATFVSLPVIAARSADRASPPRTHPAAMSASAPLVTQANGPIPIQIGDQIPGSFGDATGHSAQSHLVYAANSRVWWLFTVTSGADAQGGSNHIVKAYHSSGPDLTTATWVAAVDSPGAASGSPNGSLAGGRSLGVAYVNNSPVDVIHADISMAFDGQDGRTGHIRGVVTGTTIR